MAVGQKFTGIVSVAAGSTTDLKPPTGVEATIHNIFVSGACKIKITDGTNTVEIDTYDSSIALMAYYINVTDSYWVQIENTGTSDIVVAFDGVITYES